MEKAHTENQDDLAKPLNELLESENLGGKRIVKKIYKKKKCDHYFEMVKPLTAECKHCRAGFFLSPGMNVNKGHIT